MSAVFHREKFHLSVALHDYMCMYLWEQKDFFFRPKKPPLYGTFSVPGVAMTEKKLNFQVTQDN